MLHLPAQSRDRQPLMLTASANFKIAKSMAALVIVIAHFAQVRNWGPLAIYGSRHKRAWQYLPIPRVTSRH